MILRENEFELMSTTLSTLFSLPHFYPSDHFFESLRLVSFSSGMVSKTLFGFSLLHLPPFLPPLHTSLNLSSHNNLPTHLSLPLSRIPHSRITQHTLVTSPQELFSSTVGPLKSHSLAYDQNGKSKGIATVQFVNIEHAGKAWSVYNGRLIDGSEFFFFGAFRFCSVSLSVRLRSGVD